MKPPERFVVYVAGDISQGELTRALRDAGLVMRTEAGHRLVVDRVPAFVRKGPALTNVVPLVLGARRLKGKR